MHPLLSSSDAPVSVGPVMPGNGFHPGFPFILVLIFTALSLVAGAMLFENTAAAAMHTASTASVKLIHTYPPLRPLSVNRQNKVTIVKNINLIGIKSILVRIAWDEDHFVRIPKPKSCTIYRLESNGLFKLKLICNIIYLFEICVVMFAAVLYMVIRNRIPVSKKRCGLQLFV